MPPCYDRRVTSCCNRLPKIKSTCSLIEHREAPSAPVSPNLQPKTFNLNGYFSSIRALLPRLGLHRLRSLRASRGLEGGARCRRVLASFRPRPVFRGDLDTRDLLRRIGDLTRITSSVVWLFSGLRRLRRASAAGAATADPPAAASFWYVSSSDNRPDAFAATGSGWPSCPKVLHLGGIPPGKVLSFFKRRGDCGAKLAPAQPLVVHTRVVPFIECGL